MAEGKQGRKLPKVTRDTSLFSVGLGLTINEALRTAGDRPYLLALFAGMMGLPVFFNLDEKFKANQKEQLKDAPLPGPPSPPQVPPTTTPTPKPEKKSGDSLPPAGGFS